MNGRRTLLLVTVLALTSVTGLVIMLVADAPLWDRAGFALTAAPLAIGLWRAARAKNPPRRGDAASSADEGLLIENEGE